MKRREPARRGQTLHEMRSVLADIVLVTHLCVAGFIVFGLASVWTYRWHGWGWTRNFRFRLLHAAAIAVVALESVLGIQCPLTSWEDALRGDTSGTGFIQRWVSRLLYYDFPAAVFAIVYLAVAAATLLAWVKLPPRRKASPPAPRLGG